MPRNHTIPSQPSVDRTWKCNQCILAEDGAGMQQSNRIVNYERKSDETSGLSNLS